MKIKMIKQGMIMIAAAFCMYLFAAASVYAMTLEESTPVYIGSGNEYHLKASCGGESFKTKTTLSRVLKDGYIMCKSCADEIQLNEADRTKLMVEMLPYTTKGTISTSESSDSSSESTSDTSQDSDNKSSKTTKTSDNEKADTSGSASNTKTKSKTTTKSNTTKTTSGNANTTKSSNSSSSDDLMTQKQRKNRFMSKTNPKRGAKPVTAPRLASSGFSYANFGTYNSYNSENNLGGTPIYLFGVITDMQPVKNLGSQYSVAVMVNDADGYQWYMRVKCDKSKYEVMKAQLTGKNLTIYGTYAGYSGVTNRPMMDIDVVYMSGLWINMSTYQ